MSNVFANGLEISGKAVNAKTIAAFPDVCFTPPENPATPPGVPVPYPSFGLASDTEQGTGTVKIGGKTVNIKNKSDLSRTSGTEAGCAAKKGVVTSKNTGKEYFHSWSNNVKFDGEPVIRMTDMASNNHASPAGNTPLWVHIANLSAQGNYCRELLDGFGIEVHRYDEASEHCKGTGKQSDHIVPNSFFRKGRDYGRNRPNFPNYNMYDAPCICLSGPSTSEQSDYGSHGLEVAEHGVKTQAFESPDKAFVRDRQPTYRFARRSALDATETSNQELVGQEDNSEVLECLQFYCDVYFAYAAGLTQQAGDTPTPSQRAALEGQPVRRPGTSDLL
ncbi:MAG: DUF4150 domain-containing protein [Mesorhizobium sp.]|nr:MAG: DUF4150 domain-containing protein [Mesorhizobium sp.]